MGWRLLTSLERELTYTRHRAQSPTIVSGREGCSTDGALNGGKRKTDHSLARSCMGWRLLTSLERELTYTRHRAAIFRAVGDRLPRLGDRLFVVSDVADGP